VIPVDSVVPAYASGVTSRAECPRRTMPWRRCPRTRMGWGGLIGTSHGGALRHLRRVTCRSSRARGTGRPAPVEGVGIRAPDVTPFIRSHREGSRPERLAADDACRHRLVMAATSSARNRVAACGGCYAGGIRSSWAAKQCTTLVQGLHGTAGLTPWLGVPLIDRLDDHSQARAGARVTVSRLNRTCGLPSFTIEWEGGRRTVSIRT